MLENYIYYFFYAYFYYNEFNMYVYPIYQLYRFINWSFRKKKQVNKTHIVTIENTDDDFAHIELQEFKN